MIQQVRKALTVWSAIGDVLVIGDEFVIGALTVCGLPIVCGLSRVASGGLVPVAVAITELGCVGGFGWHARQRWWKVDKSVATQAEGVEFTESVKRVGYPKQFERPSQVALCF